MYKRLFVINSKVKNLCNSTGKYADSSCMKGHGFKSNREEIIVTLMMKR